MTLIRSYTINNLVPLVPHMELSTFFLPEQSQTQVQKHIPLSLELSLLEDTKRLLFSEKARIDADLA